LYNLLTLSAFCQNPVKGLRNLPSGGIAVLPILNLLFRKTKKIRVIAIVKMNRTIRKVITF
jgi:hypothetical protein